MTKETLEHQGWNADALQERDFGWDGFNEEKNGLTSLVSGEFANEGDAEGAFGPATGKDTGNKVVPMGPSRSSRSNMGKAVDRDGDDCRYSSFR